MALVWYFVPVFVVLSGLWVVVVKHKHLLVVLLGLEQVVVGGFCLILFLLVGFDSESYFSVMFLTFAVCEGSLGLALLVSLSRSYGNDYFGSFSVLQC
uniref:NADH-ubiquinone oxidoreductase chain 4L n=1 Tax=Occasjapyx japonicus TaxID=289462 RepID=U3KTM3_9HEXA|nr:NADH dehydrogenase subunit 4L [Occasjapyx japonicus]AEV44869.1 NADH dehydrogenase subunit 4L [Occasjapyx japonicus]